MHYELADTNKNFKRKVLKKKVNVDLMSAISCK